MIPQVTLPLSVRTQNEPHLHAPLLRVELLDAVVLCELGHHAPPELLLLCLQLSLALRLQDKGQSTPDSETSGSEYAQTCRNSLI